MQDKRLSLQGFLNLLTFRAKGMKGDFGRIYRASKSTALLVLLVELYLGVILILELSILSGLVDALIGARAIEVVTSDVTKYVWWQIALFISLLPVLAIQHQFDGLVAKLGKQIRRLSFVTSTAVVSFVTSPILIFFFVFGALVELYVKKKYFTFAYSAIVLLSASFLVKSIVVAGIYKAANVGDVLYWGGALLALSGYLALRPYLVTSNSF